MSRKYRALILNDYEHTPYAEWVKTGRKTIETRMGRFFSHRGDLVICCGKSNSVGSNAGKALCIVDLYEARPMNDTPEEVAAACIEWAPNRNAHLLRNWRHFSRDFSFSTHATKKNFQGIFEIEIPDDVEIIPRPDIKPFAECVYPNVPIAIFIEPRGDKPAGMMFNYESLKAAAEEKNYPDMPLAGAINKTMNDISSQSIRTLTQELTIKEWLQKLSECRFKTQALLKLSPKCEGMKRNTILEAIMCARSYRESLEVYNDKEDFWMQVYNEVKTGAY